MNKIILSLALVLTFLMSSRAQTTEAIVELDYQDVNGKLMVSAEVNGTPGKFVFDTGAPFYLTESFAHRIGLQLTGTTKATGATGEQVSMSTAQVKQVCFGKDATMNLTNVTAHVMIGEKTVEAFGADGIIGSDFFADCVVRLDGKEHKILIANSMAPFKISPRCRISMNNNNAQNIPFLSLNLGQGVIDGMVMFDSGASHFLQVGLGIAKGAVLPAKAAQVLAEGYGTHGAGIGGSGANDDMLRLKLAMMRIGMGKFANVVAYTTKGPSSSLGTAILKYGVVTLDNPNHYFYYEPYSTTPVDLYEKQWNLGLSLDSEGYVVISAIWKGIIKTDNLSIGDRIIEVGGIPVGKKNVGEGLRGSLLDIKGDHVDIKVQKKDGTVVNSYLERQ